MRLPVTLAVLSASLLASASARASSRLPSAEPVARMEVASKWTVSAGKIPKKQLTKDAPTKGGRLRSPALSPIVPNGVISANDSVKPVITNSQITPHGVISLPNVARAIYLPPVNPQTRETEIAQLELT